MTQILTLTMNPALDVSTSVDKVEPTRKLRCGPVVRDPGGGGINVARVLTRLGCDTLAIYPAGGPTGDSLSLRVAREGIAAHVVPVAAETRESFTALENESGAEFRFVLPGPELTEAEGGAVLAALRERCTARYVVLSGSLPAGVPDDFYARAAAIATACGARVILDTSGPALAQALGPHIHLVKPNRNELVDLAGRDLGDEADAVAACRRLIADGRAELVALTLGADGAILVSRDEAMQASAVPVETRSAVGAGDSFIAGLVARLAAGADLSDAFRCAVAAGSAALLTPGTTLALADDIRALTEQVTVRKL